MIKKLNSDRYLRERILPDWYNDKGTTDFTRVDIQLYDIKFRLDELRDRIFLHALRLRHAITHTSSKQVKTELKLQERIVKGNLDNIEKLQKENAQARRQNMEKEYGKDFFNWDY